MAVIGSWVSFLPISVYVGSVALAKRLMTADKMVLLMLLPPCSLNYLVKLAWMERKKYGEYQTMVLLFLICYCNSDWFDWLKWYCTNIFLPIWFQIRMTNFSIHWIEYIENIEYWYNKTKTNWQLLSIDLEYIIFQKYCLSIFLENFIYLFIHCYPVLWRFFTMEFVYSLIL